MVQYLDEGFEQGGWICGEGFTLFVDVLIEKGKERVDLDVGVIGKKVGFQDMDGFVGEGLVEVFSKSEGVPS